MKTKEMPTATLENLLPPITNRTYFEDAQHHRFRSRASAFEPVNAWWLAETALLAYADRSFVTRQFATAGLATVDLLDEAGAQCYLAHNETFAIVAFRGTQVPKAGGVPDWPGLLREVVRDVDTDRDFRLVESGQGGCVHSGFKAGLDALWPKLRPIIESHVRAGRDVWMTGHSLGAALATLAADRFGAVQGLYTFGSPCVGDRAFADDFHVSAYRFVHDRDIVTRVPPFGFYESGRGGRGDYVHVGALKFIDGEGRLWDGARRPQSLLGLLGDASSDLLNDAARFRIARLLKIPAGFFGDHAPLYYATRAWNLYVDSRR
jgi:triacylglycerol lipase